MSTISTIWASEYTFAIIWVAGTVALAIIPFIIYFTSDHK